MARLSAAMILTVLIAVALSGPGGLPHVSQLGRQNPSWTIMVYMADDFMSSLNWQDDFNEMEAAIQAPGMNIVVLVDPYGSNNSALYRVEHDPNLVDPTIVSGIVNDSGAVISGGEVNMAATSTLRSFIEFSASSYPADMYVLILWGHGAGWRGLCPDGTDVLTLPELGDALSQASSTVGIYFDLIAVDSCAEATVETLWQIHNYARYLLASEKDVPFQGLPYTIVLNDLAESPGQSVLQFASKIAEDYVLWCGSNTDYSVTMGVFDLSAVEPLVKVLDSLSAQGEKYDLLFHDVLRTAFNASESYEEAFAVDFRHFMWQLQQSDLPLEIRYYAVESLVNEEAVVDHFAKYNNPSPVNGVKVLNASGLTLYAPVNASIDLAYENISLAMTHWFEFGRLLRNNTTTIPNGLGPTVSYSSSVAVLSEATDGLSSNQVNDTAHLTWAAGTQANSVWIFRIQSGGLTFESSMTSSGSESSVNGPSGSLTLATSSYLNGSVNSYRTVNITLEGTLTIVVKASHDGLPVGHLSDEYDVSMITAGNKRVKATQPSSTSTDDETIFIVKIPGEASVGDLVAIEIIDKSSGEVRGTKNMFLPANSATVNIEIKQQEESPYVVVIPLLLALLPGLLILGFSLSLYFQDRRDKGRSSGPRTSS